MPLLAVKPKTAKPGRPVFLIYGPAGIGKTWMALEFPGVYYIDTEGGASQNHYKSKLEASGGAYFGPKQGAMDFSLVLQEIRALASEAHQFKTLVIDSFSKLFLTQVAQTEEVMEAKGIKQAFGNEKKEAIKLSRRLIHWLNKLDMNVALVCHERSKWEKGEEVGHTFDGWPKLAYELDLTLRCYKQGASRKGRVIKTRLAAFEDGEIFDWKFSELSERFGQSVLNAGRKSIALATEKQVGRLEQLISLLHIDPAVTAKWLEKAGADNFHQFDSEIISQAISNLEKKLREAA